METQFNLYDKLIELCDRNGQIGRSYKEAELYFLDESFKKEAIQKGLVKDNPLKPEIISGKEAELRKLRIEDAFTYIFSLIDKYLDTVHTAEYPAAQLGRYDGEPLLPYRPGTLVIKNIEYISQDNNHVFDEKQILNDTLKNLEKDLILAKSNPFTFFDESFTSILKELLIFGEPFSILRHEGIWQLIPDNLLSWLAWGNKCYERKQELKKFENQYKALVMDEITSQPFTAWITQDMPDRLAKGLIFNAGEDEFRPIIDFLSSRLEKRAFDFNGKRLVPKEHTIRNAVRKLNEAEIGLLYPYTFDEAIRIYDEKASSKLNDRTDGRIVLQGPDENIIKLPIQCLYYLVALDDFSRQNNYQPTLITYDELCRYFPNPSKMDENVKSQAYECIQYMMKCHFVRQLWAKGNNNTPHLYNPESPDDNERFSKIVKYRFKEIEKSTTEKQPLIVIGAEISVEENGKDIPDSFVLYETPRIIAMAQEKKQVISITSEVMNPPGVAVRDEESHLINYHLLIAISRHDRIRWDFGYKEFFRDTIGRTEIELKDRSIKRRLLDKLEKALRNLQDQAEIKGFIVDRTNGDFCIIPQLLTAQEVPSDSKRKGYNANRVEEKIIAAFRKDKLERSKKKVFILTVWPDGLQEPLVGNLPQVSPAKSRTAKSYGIRYKGKLTEKKNLTQVKKATRVKK